MNARAKAYAANRKITDTYAAESFASLRSRSTESLKRSLGLINSGLMLVNYKTTSRIQQILRERQA